MAELKCPLNAHLNEGPLKQCVLKESTNIRHKITSKCDCG